MPACGHARLHRDPRLHLRRQHAVAVSRSWASNTLVQGMDTTATFTPCSASFFGSRGGQRHFRTGSDQDRVRRARAVRRM